MVWATALNTNMLPDTDALIAAGTGHRTQNMPRAGVAWAREKTFAAAPWLKNSTRPVDICLSGLASGFDLWWAAAGLEAGMRLWVAIPFEEQASRFTAADRGEWERLRGLAEHEVVVGTLDGLTGTARDKRVRQLLAARNQLMVVRADYLVCCWDPTRTVHCGTYGAICMAHRRRTPLPGVHIDPLNRRVVRGLPQLAPAAEKVNQ